MKWIRGGRYTGGCAAEGCGWLATRALSLLTPGSDLFTPAREVLWACTRHEAAGLKELGPDLPVIDTVVVRGAIVDYYGPLPVIERQVLPYPDVPPGEWVPAAPL